MTELVFSFKARRLRRLDPDNSSNIRAEIESQAQTFHELLQRTVFRPFKMMFQEPILVLVTIYVSIVYAVLYAREPPPSSHILILTVLHDSIRSIPRNFCGPAESFN